MSDSVATRQRYLLVLLLFLHTVNTYLDRVCISAAKGPMQGDIEGLTDQMMGYVFGIFAIGYALFQVPAGWFSDRVGPRRALTIVVIVWSVFTALTGAVFTAISLVLMPAVIDWIGWRMTFVANGAVGLIWGAVWWFWYRDSPEEHGATNKAEVDLISRGIRAQEDTHRSIPYAQIVTSSNVLLAMFQYASSNMTFFISITWLRPYIEQRWGSAAANLSAVPLLVGAVSLWVSGSLVTYLHHRGMPVLSRRIPAMVGYAIGATGLLLCTQTSQAETVWPLIICFSIALFGVEMTLSPSWSFCMDIGGDRSGAVSGAMNMVGNLGAAVSAMVFPYFVAHVTLPFFAVETGTANSFFVFAAVMNILAIVAWCFMNPQRVLQAVSPAQLRLRIGGFIMMFIVVTAALVYTNFLRA